MSNHTDPIESELVVLLHGLLRRAGCWRRLRRRLERAGYRTVAWTYPSLWWTIQDLGRDCRERLAVHDADPAVRTFHVVTHSLGGIILRHALTLGVPAKLGRVVMLAPPNRGSAWARRLGPWLGWLAPALRQLSDAPDSFVNRLGSERYDVRSENGPGETGTGVPAVRIAVIAAARDAKCPLPTTHLPGEIAHITVRGRHTFIMYRRDVADAVLACLEAAAPASQVAGSPSLAVGAGQKPGP
ncbi:MAG: alpha/beta hydrolase [Planctomycetes bacterium]|nr:alpha/beta hydrolase [Planctomycetota bacterium]